MIVIKKRLGMMICFLCVASMASAQSLADARKATDAEQYQRAKYLLQNLINTKPNQAENYFYLGDVYLKIDSPDSAKILFNKGIFVSSKYPLNYVGVGSIALLEGDSLSAKEYFHKAIALAGKKDHLCYLNIARAYIRLPKPSYDKALTYLEEAKLIDEKDAQVYLAMGDVYRGQMKNAEAYSAYRTAFDLNRALLRSKVELGVINKISKAFQESVDEFNSVFAIDPNYGPAYRELAETYYLWAKSDVKQYQSRIKQALSYYEKYMDLTDRSLESRMRHADFLILAKEYQILETEAKEMIKIDQVNPKILRYLGYAAYEVGNYTSTIQALNNFISKVNPNRIIPQDYIYLGRAKLQNGSLEEGIMDLKKAIFLDSSNVSIMREIGKALYDSKKYSQAARIYEFFLGNSKSTLFDYYYLGSSYYFDFGAKKTAGQTLDNDLLIKADSAFNYVARRSPSTYGAWQFRGRISRQLDDAIDSRGLAVPYYEKYVDIVTVLKPELAPNNTVGLIEAYTYLGSVAARRDRDDAKAKAYFNQVLVLDPDNKVVKKALKALASSDKSSTQSKRK